LELTLTTEVLLEVAETETESPSSGSVKTDCPRFASSSGGPGTFRVSSGRGAATSGGSLVASTVIVTVAWSVPSLFAASYSKESVPLKSSSGSYSKEPS